MSGPICELELELKSGEPRRLFELALALLEIAPIELEPVSKAEQGYRLLGGYVEKPVKGAAPALVRTVTLAEALQALIWSCLQHLQSNLRGAMASDDAAGHIKLRFRLSQEALRHAIFGPTPMRKTTKRNSGTVTELK